MIDVRKFGMKRAVVLVPALLLLVGLAVPSLAYERPGQTIRVSVSSTGEQADVSGDPPKFIPNSKGYINEAGRYVTFEAWAPNLVEEDREGILRPHIFRHDLVTRETIRVTTRWDGRKSDQGGRGAQQTPDGRYIAFFSASSDFFETPDTTRGTDVYVRDMETGTLEKITVAPDGSDGSNGSPINLNNAYLNDISADGRFVTVYSTMTNLTEGTDANGKIGDVFLRDRATQTTEIVSVSSDGEQGNDVSAGSSVTLDGTEVIFSSYATNLVDEELAPGANIYVRDRVRGTTELLDVAGEGQVPDGEVDLGGMSDDGRFILFNSGATNLIPYDGNAAWDTFVHDRATGRTERVSVTGDGSEGDRATSGWEISSDGRYVTLDSDATNLVEGDTNLRGDAFVRDRLLGTTRRISVADDGTEGNRASTYSSITADGSTAAFDSTATNLVEGDTNQEKDIFVRFLGPDVGIGSLSVEVGEGSAFASGWAGFAGAVVASGDDPAGDNPEGTSDLIGASVTVRPEDESVRLVWDLRRLSSLGAPGVIYGMSFQADGTSWEIRGMPTVSGTPRFNLYKCDGATCVVGAELRARYGREGSSVVVTIPENIVPFSSGTELTSVQAYTALGEGAIARVGELDSVDLGTFALAAPELSFGIARRGSSDVVFAAPVAPSAGAFNETIDLGGADPDLHDLWVRACLADRCSTKVHPLGEGVEEPVLEATSMTLDFIKDRGNVRALGTLKTEGGGLAIEGRVLTTYLNGAPIGTAVTDVAGVAAYDIPRRHAKSGDVVEMVFAGDDAYLGSRAFRTIVVQDL